MLKKRLNRVLSIIIDSKIHKTASIYRFSFLRKCSVDAYSYIGCNCRFNDVVIGKFCSIANRVTIGLGDHPMNRISTSPIFFSPENGTNESWVNSKTYNDEVKPTFIGNDVWIGQGVTILGGIRIGNGAVIATGAIVTKDIPPYAIVAGVPAKILKYRFNNELVDALNRSKWWENDSEFLKKSISYFTNEVSLDQIDIIKHDKR